MSQPYNAIAMSSAYTDLFEHCAKVGFYTLTNGVSITALDLLDTAIDPENHNSIRDHLPPFAVFALDSTAWITQSDNAKLSYLRAIPGETTAELLTTIGAYFLGGFIGKKICTLIIVNRFDAPLVLERSTYNKGSSSGYEVGHPAIMNTKTKAFTQHNNVPARFEDSHGNARDGIGIFRFDRRKVGFVGCDGGLRFTCASKEAPNGVTIAFENGADKEVKIASSVNSTDLDAFKDKWIDDRDGNKLTSHSDRSSAHTFGSTVPYKLWNGDDTDYSHMVLTVVVGPK